MSKLLPKRRLKNQLPVRGKRRRKNKKARPRYIKMTRKRGVVCKLSEQLIDSCVELILEGLPIKPMCDYLSITPDAYYDWKEKGEKFDKELFTGQEHEFPEYEIHALFLRCIVRAKAEWQLEKHRNSLQNKAKNKADWVRDITQLERRDRANWSRSETIAVAETAPLPDEAYL